MNFALILICLISGHLIRRSGRLGNDAHLGLNSWLIHVAIPAAALYYVPQVTWTAQMVWPMLSPTLVWLGAWALWGRKREETAEERKRRGALLLSAGLCNTSFVGFPLTLAYYGDEGLKVAVVCDQMSFLLLSTVGVVSSMSYGGVHDGATHKIAAKLLKFPPFIGFVVSLCFPQIVSWGELPQLWQKLAATLIPVALFSIGLQLDHQGWVREPSLKGGLLYKLWLAPLLVASIVWIGGGSGLIAKVAVFEAAMATMATTSVLAVEYHLNARLTNLMVGVGIPLSLGTTYCWWWILERIF